MKDFRIQQLVRADGTSEWSVQKFRMDLDLDLDLDCDGEWQTMVYAASKRQAVRYVKQQRGMEVVGQFFHAV